MLIDDYLELQIQYQKKYGDHTVVLMEVGSFYELYGVNNDTHQIGKVESVSRLLDIQMTRKNKKQLANNFHNPLLAGFPSFCLQKYLERLVENNYTVVVVEQDRPGSGATRNVTGVYSPGVFLSESSQTDNKYLMVCYFENGDANSGTAIGVSLLDITTGATSLYQFYPESEDLEHSYDSVYRLIQGYQPAEVVCVGKEPNPPGSLIDNSLLDVSMRQKNLASYLDLDSRKTHYIWSLTPEYSKISYQNTLLEKYFPNHGMISVLEYLALERHPYALQSYLYALNFIYKHLPTLLDHVSIPEIVDEENRLILSRDSALQLHIVSNGVSQPGISKKHGSLLEIINHTRTSMGKRLLRDRLLTPVTDISTLNQRYDRIDQVSKISKEVSASLAGIMDIERLHRRALLGRLAPTQFYNLHECYTKIVEVGQTLTDHQVYLTNDSESIQMFESLESYIDFYRSRLHLERCLQWNLDQIDQNPFREGLYPSLDEYQSRVQDSIAFFDRVALTLSKIIEPAHPNPTGVKVEYNERDGYHFSVTQKRLQFLKTRWPDSDPDIPNLANMTFRNAQSKNNRVVKMFSPEIKQVHENRIKYQALIQESAKKIFTEQVILWHTSRDGLIRRLIGWIAELDVSVSNAIIANEYGYNRPRLVDSDRGYLQCQGLRHPIIERIQHDIEYVPNDVTLGYDTHQGLLLYGVNACGKSSLMRSIGCGVILAQAGCYVPAGQMILSPFSYLFTRISNNDNLFKGQSTFAVEMSELRSILQRANNKSLVLGDELCSGTESTSALAIVSAGVETLTNSGAAFMFATHLHSLSTLPNIMSLKDQVQHYHLRVHYNPSTKSLTYDRSLVSGCGSSLYGLEVCRAMDLPANFITRANEIRQQITGESETVQSTKKSHYNHQLFMDKCQICGSKATEVHHIKFQCTADSQNLIEGRLPKDHKSNLVALCEKCHHETHLSNLVIHGYVATSEGIRLHYDYNNQISETHKNLTHPRKITQEIEDELLQLKTQSHMTHRRMIGEIKKKYNVAISTSSVSRILKKNKI